MERTPRLILLAVFTWLLVIGIQAFAHHGSRVSYDMTHMVTVKGVVTDFVYSNPHCYVLFDVKDENGNVTRWAAETDPPLMMKRRFGWTKDHVKLGDDVTVTLWPSKAGTPRGFLAKLVTADGRVTDHSAQLPPDRPE